jgi:CRISPR-associated protein Cas1
MPILYLSEQGSKVHKEGNRIIVRKEDATLIDISLFKIDTIVVLGNVHFSTQALGDILTKGIDIAFLTLNGRLKGRIESYKSKNIPLKLRQYEVYKNKEKSLQFAKIFLKAKAENACRLLKSYDYRYKELNLKEDIDEIEKKKTNIDDKTTIDSLMGVEGYISRVYFTGFKKIVNSIYGQEIMEERQPRGSFSFVNQMLSLGYVCWTNEIMAALNASGLDPYLGFLHSIDYGRPSFALDIVEEYRQPVIDRLTLNLINKRLFNMEDFEASEEGLRMKQDKIKEYFKYYEEWLREKNRDYQNEKMSFREIMLLQIKKLVEALKEEKVYIPFIQ